LISDAVVNTGAATLGAAATGLSCARSRVVGRVPPSAEGCREGNLYGGAGVMERWSGFMIRAAERWLLDHTAPAIGRTISESLNRL
jgi:hypothetical protein